MKLGLRSKFSIGGIILVILLLIGSNVIFQKLTQDEISITITDKERVITGFGEDKESLYLVYTEQETFKNIDSWIYGKFDSSDFNGKLKQGETYTVVVTGWRIKFLSKYRNIVKIKTSC